MAREEIETVAELTGYLESCCWTDERQFCPGPECGCQCHIDRPKDQPTDERLVEIGREALGKIWARKTAQREEAAGGLLLMISLQEQRGYLSTELADRARALVAQLLGYQTDEPV